MMPIRNTRSKPSIASGTNRYGVVDRAGSRIALGLLAATLAAAAGSGCGRQDGEGLVGVSSALSSDPSGVTLLPACVAKTSATEWWATFGYESATAQAVIVAASASNGFQPTPVDRGQPTRFDPGLHARAFSVRFDGKALTWKLGTRTVTASSSSPSCVSPGASATAPVIGQFALYAQVDIRVDRAVVIGGDVGVALTNAMTDGRDEVSLEPSGRLDPTHGVFAHAVDLRSQASVGTVYTTRLDNQGGSFVAVKPFPTVMPPVRALMPIVPGTTPVTVASGATMTLQPGAYGAVQVNGTLTLGGGTYQIASLEIGNAGRVEATSGVRLRIQGHLHLGPSSHLRTNPVGSARDLLVEVAGNDGTTAVIVDSDTELHALVSAPSGTLVFHPRTSARGAFVARDMQINADALVVYESGFALPLKSCIAQFQISPDKVVPGKDPQDLAHTIAATACLAPDASNCEVAFLAQANFDRRSAAKQLVAGLMIPARYVAVSRDRSRKLLRAQTDPTWLAAFCRGDADGDLVPDDRDTCPGTPSLTATDDHGCTNPNLPPAPDPVKMKKVFDNLGVMISTGCDGVPEPLAPFVTDVCLDRPNLRYLITVSQDTRQPSTCLVWYQMNTFSIEKGESRENFNAMLAFERGQAVSQTATSVTLPVQLSCNPVETKGDGRSWPCDEANGDAYNTLINARAINGNGQQSPWGQTRQFAFHLCP